jgi:hypothetical protein
VRSGDYGRLCTACRELLGGATGYPAAPCESYNCERKPRRLQRQSPGFTAAFVSLEISMAFPLHSGKERFPINKRTHAEDRRLYKIAHCDRTKKLKLSRNCAFIAEILILCTTFVGFE